jgi:predicted transcriptional regulator
MIQETVRFFSDQEEECIDSLIAMGFTRRVAVLLVFLAKKRETTSHEIERGTDVQYSAISVGMKDLMGRGWVSVREIKSPKGGQAIKIYSLTMPFPKILGIIENEKKEEMKRQFAVLRRMKGNSR